MVRNYYPPGIDAHDSSYRDSPQFRALVSARAQGARERADSWVGLVRALGKRHGRDRVFDTTNFNLDSCFAVRVYEASAPKDNAVAAVLLVSVLTPLHALYTVLERRVAAKNLPAEVFTVPRKETEALVSELNREAAERLHTTLADWAILETPVPWASTVHADFTKATLADLLFSDDRW